LLKKICISACVFFQCGAYYCRHWCHSGMPYISTGWLPFRHVCVQGTTIDIFRARRSPAKRNMIQVDVMISPPSLGAPPNYFSSEAVTVASQLHLGRPTSAKRAVCMDGSHLLNRAPRRFDRGRLKVSVPAQFQRNSRSEGPGPRRGKSSLCQCALRQKKAEPTTRVHEVHTRREFGRVSVIRSGAPSATASARSFSRLVGPVGVRRAARTPPTRPTGMPVAANKICALTRTAVSRNLDFCRKKRKQRASPRSRAARSQVLRLVE